MNNYSRIACIIPSLPVESGIIKGFLMYYLSLLMFICTGITAGFVGGLFGIGGGIIVVPSLLFIFHLLGFPPESIMQTAAGTSLAAMIFTSGSSALAHYKQDGINWTVLRYLAPGMILGSVTGGILAHLLPSPRLMDFFALFLCVVGITFLFSSSKELIDHKILRFPSYYFISLIGLFIGSLSSFFGIGGGIVTIPALKAIGLSVRNAISTSAMTGFFIALFGGLTYAYFGRTQIPSDASIGYIYIPAFLYVGISASLAAHYGAKYAYILPPSLLNRIFGAFLAIIGLTMFISKMI